MKIFFLICIWLFSTLPQAQALVDMKNANFSDNWVDIIAGDASSPLKISRTYSSRSLFSGLFGFGWCSPIESKLDVTIEGNLILTECTVGSVNFYPANSNTQQISNTIDKILAYIKKNEPNRNKKSLDDLREQLKTDHKLRTRYAGEVGIRFSPVKSSIFLMDGKEQDRIVFDGTNYVRVNADGLTQKFDGTGKLVSLIEKQKTFIRLAYVGGLPSVITDNTGNKLTFSYYPERKVKQITMNGLTSQYKFTAENLISVTNAWQNAYGYAYDENHNMTKIHFPDGTFKTMSYVESKDWIREFKDRDGCIETYDFTLSPENPKDHYWSIAVKNCKGKTVYKHRYEFWYQMRPDKEKYLSRVLSEKNNQTLDIMYHQDLSKPISIRKNADVTTYQYLPNGTLKQKTVSLFVPQSDETNKYSLSFDYDKEGRIENAVTDYFNKSGKLLRKKKTLFKYDVAGRLTQARNSDGQFVDIKYNAQGLIVALADHTKKEVLIEYDPKTQKPTSIARPDVGSLQLTYAATGEIKKINNRGGSTTTSQIFSTFNNFIDMVGPVSTELSLNL